MTRPGPPDRRLHAPSPRSHDGRATPRRGSRRAPRHPGGLPRGRGRRRRAAQRARRAGARCRRARRRGRRRCPSRPPPAARARPHHRPAARRRAVADAVRVPQPGVRRPSLRDDRAGPAAAGGAYGARRRRHDPDREPAGRRPGVRGAAAARRDHRGRDRQRAVERDAELPAPLRGRPRPARVRRTGVRGRAVAGLGRRHLLEARRGGAGRAGRLPCLVRLPRPPRAAGARAGVVRRRRPDGPVAGLLRQPRAAQPGRRAS